MWVVPCIIRYPTSIIFIFCGSNSDAAVKDKLFTDKSTKSTRIDVVGPLYTIMY